MEVYTTNISCPDEVTDAFRKYFDSKIQIIRENLDKARVNMPETVDDADPPSTHNPRFHLLKQHQKLKFSGSITNLQQNLPTQLVKEHAVSLLPVIT